MRRALILLQLVALASCATPRPSGVSTATVSTDIANARGDTDAAIGTTAKIDNSVGQARSTADRIDDKLVLFLQHEKGRNQ